MANRARAKSQKSKSNRPSRPAVDAESTVTSSGPPPGSPSTGKPNAARPARPAKARKRVAPPPPTTGRYTPPIPKSQKVSPLWVPIVMFTALGLGMAMIILNYVDILPGGTSNGYLLGGLGLITVGFITATRYH